MNWQAISFDWNQARAFLATAEEGSLSAASRALGLTQPTLGRQVAALEAELGVVLFERVGRSLALTPSGLELLEHVRSMADAASQLSLTASGRSLSIAGQVCITATDMTSAFLLPPLLARLRELAPQVHVEVLVSNALQDLRRREADIAIRHARPTHGDLIARLVRVTSAHLYASTAYLDGHGRPQHAGELSALDFIAFEDVDRAVTALNACGLALGPENFGLTTNNGIALLNLVQQGLGISMLPRDIADPLPDLEAILPDSIAYEIPVWLTTHRELHSSRRIRLVYDFLAESLAGEDAASGGLAAPQPMA